MRAILTVTNIFTEPDEKITFVTYDKEADKYDKITITIDKAI